MWLVRKAESISRASTLSVWIDGWMQGALESGNRVASEVNAAP